MKRSRRGKVARDLVQRAMDNSYWKNLWNRTYTKRAFAMSKAARIDPSFLGTSLLSAFGSSVASCFRDISNRCIDEAEAKRKLQSSDLSELEVRVFAQQKKIMEEGGIKAGDFSMMYAPALTVAGKSMFGLKLLRSRMGLSNADWQKFVLDTRLHSDYVDVIDNKAWADKDGIDDVLLAMCKAQADSLGVINLHPKLTEEERNYLSDGIDLADNAKRFAEGVEKFRSKLRVLKVPKERPTSDNFNVVEDRDNMTVIEIDSMPASLFDENLK